MYTIFSTVCRIGKEPDYRMLVPLTFTNNNDAARCCLSLDRKGYTVWKVVARNGHVVKRERIERAIKAGNGAVRATLS